MDVDGLVCHSDDTFEKPYMLSWRTNDCQFECLNCCGHTTLQIPKVVARVSLKKQKEGETRVLGLT